MSAPGASEDRFRRRFGVSRLSGDFRFSRSRPRVLKRRESPVRSPRSRGAPGICLHIIIIRARSQAKKRRKAVRRMGKRRFFVHNSFQFGRPSRAAVFASAAPPACGARVNRAKKRLFPTISRSPSFPYFTRNSGVFDTPRDNVSPPPKKEPRGEKTAAGRLVSYAQKKARRFVHLVYFSA